MEVAIIGSSNRDQATRNGSEWQAEAARGLAWKAQHPTPLKELVTMLNIITVAMWGNESDVPWPLRPRGSIL